MQIMGPTHELPQTDTTERKFLSQCRLYIGNLVDCSEEELIEMFKPYGEVSENFLNKEKMFAFIRLVSYFLINFKYKISIIKLNVSVN